SGFSSCGYEYALYKADLTVIFTPYWGGSLAALAQQLSSGGSQDTQITTNQSISGVGDQALFIAVMGTFAATSTKQYPFLVVDGSVVFELQSLVINNTGGIGNIPDDTASAHLKAVAKLIVNRL